MQFQALYILHFDEGITNYLETISSSLYVNYRHLSSQNCGRIKNSQKFTGRRAMIHVDLAVEVILRNVSFASSER